MFECVLYVFTNMFTFLVCLFSRLKKLFFDYRYDVGLDNDLIVKPGKTVAWMKDPKMANKISKKNPGLEKALSEARIETNKG